MKFLLTLLTKMFEWFFPAAETDEKAEKLTLVPKPDPEPPKPTKPRKRRELSEFEVKQREADRREIQRQIAEQQEILRRLDEMNNSIESDDYRMRVDQWRENVREWDVIHKKLSMRRDA